MTVWLLGDQLSPDAAPLANADRVLMIEAHAFADRLPYHPAKLTLVFSAMRHCRDALRDRGYEVTYVEAETFGDGLDEYFAAAPGDSLVLMDPPSHGAAAAFEGMVEARGGSLTVVGNDRFLTTPETFDEWAGDRTVEDGFRQERWYRFVRRKFDLLMDGDGPEGGGVELRRREPRDTPREVVAAARSDVRAGRDHAGGPRLGAGAVRRPLGEPVARRRGLADDGRGGA